MRAMASELELFIATTRALTGRGPCSPFSLDNMYFLADYFGLKGVLYLEKLEESRHVNVVFNVSRDKVVLYDPMRGVKKRCCNETEMGMYCKPLGSIREDFEEHEKSSVPYEGDNPWKRCAHRGQLLLEFLEAHDGFNSLYGNRILALMDFPALQISSNSTDCAPITLFVMSLCHCLQESQEPFYGGQRSLSQWSTIQRERLVAHGLVEK
jgi:hypothetical protein